MKRSRDSINFKRITQLLGIGLGIIAIYLSLKNIRGESLSRAIMSMNAAWIIPIVAGNFVVIALKALRWKIMTGPVKRISFPTMFRVLTIGFMANNILPARMGEAVRIHLLGKDASVSRLTTTATIISDRIIEGMSFIIIAALLVIFTNVPKWIHTGLTITLIITISLYILSAIYSTREIKNKYLRNFQVGISPLLQIQPTSLAMIVSMFSWLLQGLLIYMTQLAFGTHLPVWSVLLVLISINLAIALPSTPGHVGTFEFACILAYSYLGVDKNLGLLIGATFHLLQIIPVTLVGGLMMLASHIGLRSILLSEGPDTPC